MFEAFSFIVDLVDRIGKDMIEKALDQTVVANDLKRPPSSRTRQRDTIVSFIDDERIFHGGELLDHVGNRSWRNLQPICKFSAADPSLSTVAQMKDCLR